MELIRATASPKSSAKTSLGRVPGERENVHDNHQHGGGYRQSGRGPGWSCCSISARAWPEPKPDQGVQEATLSAITVGGAGTNSMVVMATCEDWTTYGKIQQQLNTDSEMIQLMLDGGKMATWQTYTSQTIDFDLLP